MLKSIISNKYTYSWWIFFELDSANGHTCTHTRHPEHACNPTIMSTSERINGQYFKVDAVTIAVLLSMCMIDHH
jgi:hypothetical protein